MRTTVARPLISCGMAARVKRSWTAPAERQKPSPRGVHQGPVPRDEAWFKARRERLQSGPAPIKRLRNAENARLVLNDDHCSLYRFFDSSGVLLYVGITCNLPGRMRNHGRKKPWWHDVTLVTVEHFSDKFAAAAAEKIAITNESPLHNWAHNRWRQ